MPGVTRTLIDPLKPIWYIAYGSNMAVSKFRGDRGINPLDTAVVNLPGWELIMEVPGVPYREPAFASVQRIEETDKDVRDVDSVIEKGLVNVEKVSKVMKCL